MNLLITLVHLSGREKKKTKLKKKKDEEEVIALDDFTIVD